MARKTNRAAVMADKRTMGATIGAIAHPLNSDLDAWLAKGWRVVEADKPTVEKADE